MTFPSRRPCLDCWRPHPALAADCNGYIERSFSCDPAGQPPELVCGARLAGRPRSC